jgi:hypothetical protein
MQKSRSILSIEGSKQGKASTELPIQQERGKEYVQEKWREK